MRNHSFGLLSEEKKKSKFRAILNTRTNGCLTGEELNKITHSIVPRRQYSIKVYYDAAAFLGVLHIEEGCQTKTILGQGLVRFGDLRGELACTSDPVAIIVHKLADGGSINKLHIYIPSERLKRGK